MRNLKWMRTLGWGLFGLMWIPFACIFIGMIGMPAGSYDWLELPELTRYAMVAVGVLSAASMLLLFGSAFLGMALGRGIRARGTSALATVLEIRDTGTTVNENPLVRLVLEVRPDHAPPFTAETEQLISRLQVPEYQPGEVVLVKYDPESRDVALAE